MSPQTHLIGWSLSACLCVSVLACTSAEEKCAAARAEATTAWSAYHDTIDKLVTRAKAEQSEIKTKLMGTIDKRLSEVAGKEADKNYDRNSSAWMRTFNAARQAACSEDKECLGLKQKQAEAEQLIENLGPRREQAAAARDAVAGPSAQMKTASDAVGDDDFDRAEMVKAAKASNGAAASACEGLSEAP